MSQLPVIGVPAPAFSLPSTSGETVSLAELRGRKVLLAFFPLAFTGTCTAEVCSFSEDFPEFDKFDTRVIPISVDSIPTLKEFQAKHGLKVDLCSDFKRTASKAYGVLLEEHNFSARAYFLIDGDGVLRWVHVEKELGAKRDNAELISRIEELG